MAFKMQIKDWVEAGLGGAPTPAQGVVVRFREPSLGGAAGMGEQLGRATALLAFMLRSPPVRAILLTKNRPALEDLLASLRLVLDHIETELGSRAPILPERYHLPGVEFISSCKEAKKTDNSARL